MQVISKSVVFTDKPAAFLSKLLMLLVLCLCSILLTAIIFGLDLEESHQAISKS